MRGHAVRMDERGRWVVESIDQPGVYTLPLAVRRGEEIEEGSVVLYCEFADGDGAVLMKLE